MLPLLVFVLAVLPFSAEGGEIIGGLEVIPNSRPYMAYVSPPGCGGFLVREDIVMTAAHCYSRNPKINVLLGAHNIQKKENTQQSIPVVKVIRHLYNYKTKINDIMLLKLKYKAQLNDAVKIIALPKSQDWVKPGQVCRVAGWGKTENGKYSDTLREVLLEVQNEKKCQEQSQKYNNTIQLCVGNPAFKKATDHGDSGGPFVCNGMAQGIVSYHFPGGKLPRVFTRISSYIPWIQWAIKQLERP